MQRLTKSQSLLMTRPETKRVGIFLTKRRRADSPTLKNLLRHAKVHQVSKPVYGETRSQAYRDLLDQAKASKLPNIENLLRHVKVHQVSKHVYDETRSQTCRDLLDQAKASRLPNIENFTKACKGSPNLKICL